MEYHVPESERAGAEAGNAAARLERLARRFRTVKNLEPVALRIVQDDQIRDMPLFGKRPRAACHRDLPTLQLGGQRVERRGIGNLPAEKTDALAAVGLDHNALLA